VTINIAIAFMTIWEFEMKKKEYWKDFYGVLNVTGHCHTPVRLRLSSDSRVSSLVDELLREIYSGAGSRRSSLTNTTPESDTGTVDWSCDSSVHHNREILAASLGSKSKCLPSEKIISKIN
jgi:hypothetical protein